jgi:hypothetical protein
MRAGKYTDKLLYLHVLIPMILSDPQGASDSSDWWKLTLGINLKTVRLCFDFIAQNDCGTEK